MEERTSNTKSHRVVMNDRTIGSITGVREVISFDAKEILLDTELGILLIKGQELHVNRLSLDKGEVDVEGYIDSLMYSEPHGVHKETGSLLGRLFK